MHKSLQNIRWGRLMLVGALVLAWLLAGVTPNAMAGDNYQPNYGSGIVIDGDASDWDLTLDYFADMYLAANPTFDVLSTLYVRYDCAAGVLNVLVLPSTGLPILTTPANSFVKFGLNDKKVGDNDYPPDGVQPDFAWIGLSADELQAAGWEASFSLTDPQTSYFSIPDLNVHTLIDSGGSQTSAVANRGIPLEAACSDFGDLPGDFGVTLLGDDGARHTIGALRLGLLIDGEADGQQTSTANGDDVTSKTDEDGIQYASGQTWQPGATINLTAQVSGGSGYLVGWFDFDGDLTLNQAEERVLFGLVSSGTNNLSMVLPNSYVTNIPLYVRFRLYPQEPGDPVPTGLVDGGEVEDYYWVLGPTSVHLVDFQAAPASSTKDSMFLVGLTLGLGVIGLSAARLAVRRRA